MSYAARAGAAGGYLACSASARALAQACARAPPRGGHGSQERVAPRAQARLGDPPEGAALVFNCQMGRGRTTTGMVIAALLQLRRRMPTGAATLPEHALRARPRPAPHSRAPCAQLERSSAPLQDPDPIFLHLLAALSSGRSEARLLPGLRRALL